MCYMYRTPKPAELDLRASKNVVLGIVHGEECRQTTCSWGGEGG